MGRARYRIESTRDGGILRGENGYFDGQTDVETAHIQFASGGQPKLTEFDHTYYNPDKSILKRAHVDLKTGAGTCIDNSARAKERAVRGADYPGRHLGGREHRDSDPEFFTRGRQRHQPSAACLQLRADAEDIFDQRGYRSGPRDLDDLWRRGDARPGAAGFRIAQLCRRGLRAQAACVVRSGQWAGFHRRRSGALLQGRSDHAGEAARQRRTRRSARTRNSGVDSRRSKSG